jgi:hypothetical protein
MHARLHLDGGAGRGNTGVLMLAADVRRARASLVGRTNHILPQRKDAELVTEEASKFECSRLCVHMLYK